MPTTLQRCLHAGCFSFIRLAHVAHHKHCSKGLDHFTLFNLMLLNAPSCGVAAAQDVAWEGTTVGPIRTVPVQRWISGELGL